MAVYSQVRDYLYSLKNRGSKYGIDRMRLFVDALGHPERKYPVIHVAGTNGKGSTCAILESLYRSNGYKTGLFSSPHLVHLGERAQVNRQILGEAPIASYIEHLRPIAAELGKEDPALHPTFFEFIAAMAFLHFSSEEVDIALIETGLGGRLDATNVVDPALSIITSISYDHMELLGDTLEKIATEKAGIIKPGKPVLIGCLPAEAEAVIRTTAKERGCALYSVKERFRADSLPETNLSGAFQRWNAAAAVYATEILAESLPVQSTAGLTQIDWPGRWQELELDGRKLILDATHNPEGAEALKDNLEKLVQASDKPIIVAGTLGEERGRSLMEAVSPFASELFLVKPNQDRSTPTDFLESCLPKDRGYEVHHSSLIELFPCNTSCRLGEPGNVIVVTGSIYLIGELLERIQGASESGSELQDKL
ncbi:MAG: folylpolyglutamate synthase/dihydrofolate synthase family protein [Verrucomicrobiota bacterium]